jgi:hypothetical protein
MKQIQRIRFETTLSVCITHRQISTHYCSILPAFCRSSTAARAPLPSSCPSVLPALPSPLWANSGATNARSRRHWSNKPKRRRAGLATDPAWARSGGNWMCFLDKKNRRKTSKCIKQHRNARNPSETTKIIENVFWGEELRTFLQFIDLLHQFTFFGTST